MSSGQPPSGEVRPRGAPLERAPSERYQASGVGGATAEPNVAKAVVAGIIAALVAGLAAGIMAAIFDVGLGLLVVAAVSGWAVGVAVVWGAWGFGLHPQRWNVSALAAGFGAAAWLIGSLVEWFLSRALLPGSTQSLFDRLTQTSFPTYLGEQLSIQDAVELLILAALAWRSAR